MTQHDFYVGLRIAEQAARTRDLLALAKLDDKAARPVVAAALAALMVSAGA